MRVTRGKVVGGKIVVEGEPLPEGTSVVVGVGDASEGWTLDDESTQELLQAAAEADLEEGISAEQLLAELRAMP